MRFYGEGVENTIEQTTMLSRNGNARKQAGFRMAEKVRYDRAELNCFRPGPE